LRGFVVRMIATNYTDELCAMHKNRLTALSCSAPDKSPIIYAQSQLRGVVGTGSGGKGIYDATNANADGAVKQRRNDEFEMNRMLGLSLDSWNTILVWFLGIGAVADIVVGLATFVVIKLQKLESQDAASEFAR